MERKSTINNRNRNTIDNTSNQIINNFLQLNESNLSKNQIKILEETLGLILSKYQIQEDNIKSDIIDLQHENATVLRNFINAKRIEGRSNTTLYNYAKEISKLFLATNKSYKYINSNDIRDYMSWRKSTKNLQSVSVANMRMYLMSFFKWCFKEELILKNPMDKIGVIKVEQRVIQTLSDEEQEIIRCACTSERDIAIIDMLSGSGMRVSELCGLNKSDVNFETGEVLVFGKGAKERVCFLTGKAKVHLKWYLESREDDNEALFVTAKKPYSRLTKSGVEYILKCISQNSKVPKIRLYPHKYRSTLATNMIRKGAPADQVQNILGHENIQTTMKCYVKIDKENLKIAHKNYVS